MALPARIMAVARRGTVRPYLAAAAARALSGQAAAGAHPDRAALLDCKRVVLKVGTAVVSNSDGTLALSRMGTLVEEIASLKAKGKQVMLISSGAVGLGRERVGLSKEVVSNVQNVVERQACAAAGQELLMSTYNMMFSRLSLNCAQVLITQNDFSDFDRYSYLSQTLQRLSELGSIPIINENDVVTGSSQLDPSTAGQVFSDNDTLAALIGASSQADAVLMMTDVDAVFTKPPGTPGAERIAVYTDKTEFEEGAKSTMGRGGMGSKIGAARKAAWAGASCVIANGINLSNISRVFAGEDIGTLFPPPEVPFEKKDYWMSHMAIPAGRLRVKHEVAQDLKQRGGGGLRNPQRAHDAALDISAIMHASDGMPTFSDGVDVVEGDFNAGTVVALHDAMTHKCFGRALTQQGSDEIRATLRMVGTGSKVTFGSSHVIARDEGLVIHMEERA